MRGSEVRVLYLSFGKLFYGFTSPFTEEEKRLWQKQKQQRERPEPEVFKTEPIATCIH